MPPRPAPSPLPTALAAGFLAGLAGGELFLTAGLLRHGGDLFVTSPTAGLALWIVVRSAGLFGLLGGGAGAVLAGLLHLRRRRRPTPTFAPVLGAMVALLIFAELTVRWQIEILAGLPLELAERSWGAVRHLLYALLAGAAVTAAGVGLRRWWPTQATIRLPRVAVAAAGVALLSTVAGGIGIDRVAAGGTETDNGPERPGRVVVVGLDGLTFRVLSPLLRRGELPAFQRLIDEGAWGPILTYGTASSPQVWTSMATGRRVRDHGIDDFVTEGKGYRSRPFKSFDRRSPALWTILSALDRRVGVVNWLLTFPPEKVSGYLVTRLDVPRGTRTHPPALRQELRRVWRRARHPGEGRRARLQTQIDRTFATAHHLMGKEPLDFLALYTAAADGVQHQHWKYYQPEAFDPRPWRLKPNAVARRGRLIPEVYRHLDRRLGELLDALPPDALLIVVSDHGQRAADRPRLRLRLDLLLADLGHLRLRKGEVVYPRSRAYPLEETLWTPERRIRLNLRGREPKGIVPRRRAPGLASEIAAQLRDLETDGGIPLFTRVERMAAGEKGTGSDLRLVPNPAFRDPDFLTDVADRTVELRGRRRPLRRYLRVDASISGAHDHRGVLFLHGPAVRPGYLGQRTVDTPLHEILRHLTDKVDAVDPLLPLLARLGLIERVTTLDLTPIVLHALDLPVARDMAGRPHPGLFENLGDVDRVDSYQGLAESGPDEGEADSDQELLEQLRALGYVG
jgi:predicted AlkP superfamily phosphohydrolase/phosphomutase